MPDDSKDKKPEVFVFAGPNGSGKSTITQLAKIAGIYINADDIKKTNHCTDLEAAILAEQMRENALAQKISFTFETVLSTDRNLKLLRRAKENGFFIRCVYVLTNDAENGGHSVPEDKIRSRYVKALALVPELVEVCDVMHIYDNSSVPFRIFKKRKTEYFLWSNEFWSEEAIHRLVNLP